jgi:hypothetical protein
MKEQKQKFEEAKARVEANKNRTIQDRINALDKKFGKDVGAVKERARLNRMLEKEAK